MAGVNCEAASAGPEGSGEAGKPTKNAGGAAGAFRSDVGVPRCGVHWTVSLSSGRGAGRVFVAGFAGQGDAPQRLGLAARGYLDVPEHGAAEAQDVTVAEV